MRLPTALPIFASAFFLSGALAVSTAHAGDIDVNALWTKHCQSCHGKDGKGDTKAGKQKEVKNLLDPKVRAEFKRDDLIKQVKEGIKDEKTGKERMKPFAEKLNDEEVGALVDWVLALK